MKINNLKKPGLFAAGVLFGTAGIKILTSKDAKKLYTQAAYCSAPPASNCSPARTLKNYTQTVQQQF